MRLNVDFLICYDDKLKYSVQLTCYLRDNNRQLNFLLFMLASTCGKVSGLCLSCKKTNPTACFMKKNMFIFQIRLKENEGNLNVSQIRMKCFSSFEN